MLYNPEKKNVAAQRIKKQPKYLSKNKKFALVN
jgi:hypothetical protein